MKKPLLLLLFLYLQQLFACSSSGTFINRIEQSDFITTVKILDVIPDEKKPYLNKVKIKKLKNDSEFTN